ncbi:hypothetical protein [Agrococcus sp. DT81.2]|uniref:hypothetical protein n=1 Tax=Agrococcus sp. DT81.2 TaxID=3393414 RepID=UPI003CE51C43
MCDASTIHHHHDADDHRADHAHGHGHHDHGVHHDHGTGGEAANPTAVADDQVAECPVMAGSSVVKAEAEAAGLVREFDGNRYYLCCAACGPLFDADPRKYAA